MKSIEQKLDRWESLRAIENLMGTRSFMDIMKRDLEVFESSWCSAENEPSLGLNNGYYVGYEAVKSYFEVSRKLDVLRTELVQKHYDKLSGKDIDDILGAGTMYTENLSTPVIEIAEDLKTAKGLWDIQGADIDIYPSGPAAFHKWGRVAVDFIRETDGWKIWHMVIVTDIHAPIGQSWTGDTQTLPQFEGYEDVTQIKLPEPSVQKNVYELWSKERIQQPFPAIPVPYKTFAETFSYGVGGASI